MSLKTKGRIWKLACLSGAVVMLGATLAATSAADTPPIYEGGLTFPDIQGSEGPQDFSWTVDLSPSQNLVQIDDQHAAVKYESGVTAFQIEAEPAHDAVGTGVPTTIAVSEGDVITLTVHHRAGNPAAAGAPFHYPVVEGAGWEGGLQPTIIEGPPDEEQQKRAPLQAAQPEQASAPCRVPNLKGRSMGKAWRALWDSKCALGAIHRRRSNGSARIVVRQGKAAGTVLPPGSPIWIVVGSA